MGIPAEEWRTKHPWGEDDEGHPQEAQREMGGLRCQACPFFPTGQMTKLLSKDCVSSCNDVSEEMRQLAEKRDPLGASKLEVRDVECCETDLCNRVGPVGRSLWALAGGLLLSLGPALLWILL
ncbi:hypothetical protein HPG69_014813 [Diceros bicornis minor]|uniref:Uncharacterized protein n=1 Tax=Diceros bicornis minor TaxID=77932 RepID=A0A7J7F9T1_DICBM|nr:hypothetical protein HPG69_014813 [Diceros bicornis minor]